MLSSPARHVDPLIGVDKGGNCLCGPYLPLSLVRLGPDTRIPQTSSGYRSTDPIIRFSHNHVSGTGGGGRYGNIGITPISGPLSAFPREYERGEEIAEAGYYRVKLEPSGIVAELTSTPRTGVHRYTFPEGAESSVVIDIGSVVQILGHAGSDQAISIGGFFEYISDNEIIGRADCKGGWGHSFPYSTYFYLRSDTLFVKKFSAKGNAIGKYDRLEEANVKAVAGFGQARTVELRVGISYVSIGHARASVENESAGKSFEQIRAVSVETWDKALRRIRVSGGSDDDTRMFYTMMYRLLCMPSDLGVNDEMPMWRSGVRHFTDYYCLWDSVRNANSLITLFDPGLEVDMLNCLLDIADHIGWIPDAWIAFHGAHVQGGSSADVLLSEAARKGLKGIDYSKALRQVRKNNEVESPDPWLYGRHLRDYRDLGYLSTRVLNCTSRHIEYTYQDWCIARLAETIGEKGVAADYYRSSEKIWNLWREDLKVFGPKHPDGTWAKFNPNKPECPQIWNDPYYYEGTGAEWTLTAFHVMHELVARHGGADKFAAYLDQFLDKDLRYWKELILHAPYLYHYAGKPHRSVDRAREKIRTKYSTTRAGLPDNEDMGAQSSFWMCSAMGLYPIMGQDFYLLTTPFFEKVEIDLGATGATLSIEARGAEGAAGATRYITGARLNGKELDRAWVRHEEIAGGARLELTLGDTPEGWGVREPPRT